MLWMKGEKWACMEGMRLITTRRKSKSKAEKALKEEVMGYRNHYLHHYLKFETPRTWEPPAEAGFYYNSSLSYSSHAGFWDEMHHLFSPYNLKKERKRIIRLTSKKYFTMEGFNYKKLS
jgi:hypothetical protein